jgi:NAD(P)H dehydrogenase (quinone)
MTIVVTGATGGLGRAAIESLLKRGVPAGEIVAVGRSVEKIADLADRGVVVKRASYDEPAELREAFAGADKLLFVSASDPGQRLAQHTNVVEAAKAAGVGKVVYTSFPRADTTDAVLASDHRATEALLTESGVPTVFLRNSWYIENYDVTGAVERGLVGAVGDARVSMAPRADYGEAAAAAILTEDPQRVYELGGEGATLTELTAELSRQSGREVTYTNKTPEELVTFLVGAGLPQGFAEVLADTDRAASQGALFTGTADLEKLLGRPATPLADAVRTALA